MEQDNYKESSIKATVDAVKGLVQAVPVYQDTLQPAAKQIGHSLEVVSKTVNIALAPIKAVVWGYEKIEEFITSKVAEKLKNVPKEMITTPPLQVAGPAVDALRYAGHDLNLRELYANLLASAMNKNTIDKAHPGFVEIIKNLSSDEAILLRAFIGNIQYALIDIKAIHKNKVSYDLIVSNFSRLGKTVILSRPDLICAYLDNLCRLGILEIPPMVQMYNADEYEILEADSELDAIKLHIEYVMQRKMKFQRKLIMPTLFGQQFILNVVL